MIDSCAVILAAGRGSRMGEATIEKPKCLTEFLGKTLIDHQIDSISAAGINRLAVVTGYKGELLRRDNLTRFDNPRWNSTNMIVSLVCAESWLCSHVCIISYSDIFYSPKTVRALLECETDIAISYDPEWQAVWEARFADPLSDAETFRLDDSGEFVVEIGGRAENISVIQGQYMGLLCFTPTGWGTIRSYLNSLNAESVDKLDMTALLSALIQKGHRVRAVTQIDGWGEIDNQSDLAVYEKFNQERRFHWLDP